MRYITLINNKPHVWLSGGIGDKVNGVDGKVAASEIKEIVNSEKYKEIILHINSLGGSMLDAYDIISSFKNANIKVVGVNEGFAVSAASYILASCDKRYARSYSMAMIHNPAVGNQSIDTKDVKLKNFLTKSRDGILTIYQSVFRDKTRDEIIALLNSETNFNADEQLAIGLVEEILDDDFKLVNELLELQVVNSSKVDDSIDNLELQNLAIYNCINDKIIKNKKNMEEIQSLQNELSIIKDELAKMKLEKDTLVLSNFLITNKLESDENKVGKITNLFNKYGVEVLADIADLIVVNEAVAEVANAEVVVYASKEIANLQEQLVNAVKSVANVADEIKTTEPDYEKLADEIFSATGDRNKRYEIENNNPELFQKLREIYLG